MENLLSIKEYLIITFYYTIIEKSLRQMSDHSYQNGSFETKHSRKLHVYNLKLKIKYLQLPFIYYEYVTNEISIVSYNQLKSIYPPRPYSIDVIYKTLNV